MTTYASRAAQPAPARSRHVPAAVLAPPRSEGEALDAVTKTTMESRFRRDFSGVRVHGGERAAASAAAIGAAAYTVGDRIVLGAAGHRASGAERDRLLAHELAHVAQHGSLGASTAATLSLSQPGDAAETEAESMARAVSAGRAVGRPTQRPGYVHRLVLHDDDEFKRGLRSYLVSAPIPADEVKKRAPAADAGSLSDPRKEPANAVNPPPKAVARPSLDELFPARPRPRGPLDDTLLPSPAPVPDAKSAPKPAPKPEPEKPSPPEPQPSAAKKDDDGPGPGLQLGHGTQITPSAQNPAVKYVQATVMLHDFYLVPLATLPSWLKELSFLGEPGAQFQYHLEGDKPKTVDAQVLATLIHASFDVFRTKLDVGVVAGAMVNDLASVKRKRIGKAVTPVLGGLDAELQLVKISPHLKISLDLQTLLTDPYPDPNASKPGARKAVGQGSLEFRVKVEF